MSVALVLKGMMLRQSGRIMSRYVNPVRSSLHQWTYNLRILFQDHSHIRLFKSEGWEFYNLMAEIMPNGARGASAFTPGASNAAGVVGEAPYSLLPQVSSSDSHPSSSSKHSFSELVGDEDEEMSTSNISGRFPRSKVSYTSRATSSAKRMNLDSAMNYAKSSRSSRTRKTASQVAEESFILDMQGSLNLLITSITTSLATPQGKASAKREQALRVLQEKDDDLPRYLKTFIRSSIAHSTGFTEVYMLTEDKDERKEYVMHEHRMGAGNVAEPSMML